MQSSTASKQAVPNDELVGGLAAFLHYIFKTCGPKGGMLEVIVPSARVGSGVVKISSVGMFGTYGRPDAVWNSADIQRAFGNSPIVKFVSGPR